jgi:hypothetical protein
MHVNPRHRRFLVCEDVLGPRRLREALVDVLFTDLKVQHSRLFCSFLAMAVISDWKLLLHG